jgi:hypothetical protein
MMDFKIVLRPGPVIRNEWRNGGYPAWLLERPEYGMPLHDLLEGRYPPTATLQNAHSDDAAAEWMRNATHRIYARRWLERVLRECAPDADRIVAVALDDDQGAYIDNQTYPAPHLRAYLEWLRSIVHGVTGPREPVFINTYQMKVTASSPVWAMGNWYQSEAYSLGDHDRAQLEFSTGLLHTRRHQPMMASEFAAGWLEQPNDVRPRATDPSNTALALATMIAMGVRGVVNFPVQDTLNPSGWEAPFANAFYAWDAALTIDGSRTARALPTAQFGAIVRQLGPELAASTPRYDAAIAYLGASYGTGAATNDLFANVEAGTIAAQAACRDAGLSCALVDPATLDRDSTERYPILIVPRVTGAPALLPHVAAQLARYARTGPVVRDAEGAGPLLAALRAAGRRPVVEGVPGATFASVPVDAPAVRVPAGAAFGRIPADAIAGFLTVVNYSTNELQVPAGASVALDRTRRAALPAFTVPSHAAIVVPVRDGRGVATFVPVPAIAGAGLVPTPSGIPIRNDARLPAPEPPVPATGTAIARVRDVLRDGSTTVELDNGLVRLIVSADAGARAFVFEDDETRRNIFTSVGAMRDDVAVEPPLSTSDRIAKYTHQFPAGMFNRCYTATLASTGSVAAATFAYHAPDVLPAGATFSHTVVLRPGERAVTLDETALVPGRTQADPQRIVSVTSLSVGDTANAMTTEQILSPGATPFAADSTLHVTSGNALGYYDTQTGELATIAWHAGDIEDAAILEQAHSIVVRLTLAAANAHIRFGYPTAASLDDAAQRVAAADAAAQ